MTKIEEILGFNASKSKDAESITRRYYVRAENPAEAKQAFEEYASNLEAPDSLEFGDATLDEDKDSNGLYFGTITFKAPDSGSRVKKKIDDTLFELYGERTSEGRKTASHEKRFRIKADSADSAKKKLETYIRQTALTSGRLHINEITVDEEQDGDGFFTGTVLYNNPDHKGRSDKFTATGHVPAYGSRFSETYEHGYSMSMLGEELFELRGYENVFDAHQALKASYHDEYVKEISVEEDSGGAEKTYTGRILRGEERQENDTQYNRSTSFEVSGSQTKMTHSLVTRGGWSATGYPPRNYGGLIGVTDDGVEGVDVDTAVSTFSETVYFHPWFLTTAYTTFLTRAYGNVNTAPFRGYDVGEVRFLGASGSYKSGDKAVEMTFKFAVSPNAWNLRIGNILVPFKYGWDYLWIRWADMKMGNVTVKVPIEAYVEKVYPGLDFRSLGIGF
ncbi:MAG: hypothetical protein LBT05_14910 [Planctomycetaceae bacterium]|jgi:hypothetical protein|nr:hypothetical protein [Planctomycetaceae bacterium]